MVDEENDSNHGSDNAKKIRYTRDFLLALKEKPVSQKFPSDWDRIKCENSELTFFRNVRETGDLLNHDVMDILRPEMPCKKYDPVSGQWLCDESGTQKPELGNQKPELGNQKPESGTQKPELGNQKPESGTRKPELCTQKPENKIPCLMDQNIPDYIKTGIEMLRKSEPKKVMTENMDALRPKMPCKTFDPVSGQWI